MAFSQMQLPYVSDRGGETGNSRPALLVLEGLLGEGLILLMLQDAGCPGSAAQTPRSTTVLPGAGFISFSLMVLGSVSDIRLSLCKNR